jgi:DNA mismatch endonuclease (patch repair protein)
MARVRSRNTDPERTLRRALWAAGLRYRVGFRLPGTPDVTFLGARVAVFVDGCFWHGCPEHYTAPVLNADFWRKKLARNRERDERVDMDLRALGWRSIRVWEHAMLGRLHEVVRMIRDAVETSKKRREK